MSPQTWFSVLDIDLVWAFTVLVIFSLAAGLIAGYGRRRTWASPSWAVAACVASVGLVVALTLPPTSSSFTESWCSTTTTGLPSLSGGLLTHDLLNIALLIPLGVSVTFLRPPRTALVAGAIAITVPLFVEWVQYLTPGNGDGQKRFAEPSLYLVLASRYDRAVDASCGAAAALLGSEYVRPLGM